jgi:hypothetical protein
MNTLITSRNGVQTKLLWAGVWAGQLEAFLARDIVLPPLARVA